MTYYDLSGAQRLANVTESMGCGICYETMSIPSSLSCGHSACLYCLKEWFSRGGTDCPTCRKVISGQERDGLTVNITLKKALHILIPPPVPDLVINDGNLAGEYFGQLMDGMRHGQGKFIYTSGKYKGCVIEGEWERNKIEGLGKFSSPSGQVYEIVYKGGERGKIFFPDGSVMKGIFKADEYISRS